MTGSSPPSTISSDAERRTLRINLACFTVLAVLYTIWFQRHLKGLVTQTLLIGGSLSLLGLWKLAWEAIRVGSGEKPDDWIRRTMKGPYVREYLGFAAVLLVLLYGLTSSIYLSFEGDARGQSQFTVQAWEGDRMLLPPLELNSYDRNRGRPFFFRGHTTSIEYRIVQPSGYRSLTREWTPWGQHYIRVPGDFALKQLHLLRIFPGVELATQLPDAPDTPGLRYALRITSDQGEEVLIQPLLKALVFSGMSQLDLSAATGAAELTAARQAVDDYFAQLGFPREARESTVSQLLARRQSVASPEWGGGDRLRFEVRSFPASAPADAPGRVVVEMEYIIQKVGPRIHDVVLNPK